MSATSLEFKGLSRDFGRLRVLCRVSGAAEPGQVLLVTGSNGSGKSTLLKCLAALLAPDAGTIRVREEGRDLDAPERRRRVGYLAPDLAFYDELTVSENLEFFARLRRVPLSRGEELLKVVDLPGDRLAGALSSGMRQRLRWAWALLHRPSMLLLDEPFQNLDEAGKAAARGLLEAHLESGFAVVADPTLPDLPRVATHLHLDPT